MTARSRPSREPRRRILNHLAGGPMTVGEIAANFDMAMPSISKHLSVLKEAGLVPSRSEPVRDLQHRGGQSGHSLYGFLTPFCPHARKIYAQRKRGGKRNGASPGPLRHEPGRRFPRALGPRGDCRRRPADSRLSLPRRAPLTEAELRTLSS